MKKLVAIILPLALAALMTVRASIPDNQAVRVFDEQRLADAIFLAENSKNHPYGIMAHYKHSTPRQVCLNTIKHQYNIWISSGSSCDFIAFLGKSYAPICAKNDPLNLNKNWVKNVRFYYNKNYAKGI